MGISVTDPLGWAQQRTGLMLFKPFNAAKWFALGFSAWLAQIFENSSIWSNGLDGFSRMFGGTAPPPMRTGNVFLDVLASARQFLQLNLYWLVPFASMMILIALAIYWVRARGKFMFLENVALDRADVIDPWKRLGPLANNYFFFEFRLIVMAVFLTIGTLAICYYIAEPDIFNSQFTRASATAMILGAVLILIITMSYALIKAVAVDFLIPVMYLRGTTIGPAWSEFRSRVLPGHIGAFALFYLMRIFIGFVCWLIFVASLCVTCCAAAIPYVGTVFLLPIFVFLRCYSLFFLSQFGGEYNLLTELSSPTERAFPVVMPASPPLTSQTPPPLPPNSYPGDPRES